MGDRPQTFMLHLVATERVSIVGISVATVMLAEDDPGGSVNCLDVPGFDY